MSRNNSERLGARKAPDAPPAEQTSGGFQFATPTEFVDLPTRGKNYPEGHPLHNLDQVEIRFMTAKDEDTLSSRTLLKKGLAIERFLQNIFIDKSIDVNTLTIGDKNAVLIASRITGYGPEYVTNVTCPACGTTNRHEFDISDLDVYHGDEWEDYDIQSHGENFIVKVPYSKVDVEVRTLTSRDEQYLSKLTESKKKKGLPEASLTDQMKMIVVSVNGHTDSKSVATFVDGMPARDSIYLRKAYERVVPNIDLTRPFGCSACGFEQEVTLPFTADFFWPKR